MTMDDFSKLRLQKCESLRPIYTSDFCAIFVAFLNLSFVALKFQSKIASVKLAVIDISAIYLLVVAGVLNMFGWKFSQNM